MTDLSHEELIAAQWRASLNRQDGRRRTRAKWPIEEARELRKAGWTYQMIAERYGVTAPAVHTRMHRANAVTRYCPHCGCQVVKLVAKKP